MVAVSYLAMSSQDWDFGYGYFISCCFTAIYNLLVLVLVFVLGLMVSQMGCRFKKLDRFPGEFGRNSLKLVNGFCSKSDLEGLCSSKIRRPRCCGCCKYVKDSKMSVENSKTTEESGGFGREDWDRQQTEDNVFMDCRNGNCGDTLLSGKKWAKLGNRFFAGKDVFVVFCSKILFCAIDFWRSIKNQILLPVENLNDYAKIDAGRGKSGCQQKEEGSTDFRNRIDGSTFKARDEEEIEEEVFEECEAGDLAELEQEHQNVAYLECEKDRAATAIADDDMDYRKESYMGIFMMRKCMKNEEEEDDNDDNDNDGEEEYKGEEIEEYEGEDLTGLKNAYRTERECQNAAYLELEEERKAAASAANEAMAMIQRLQSEKNLVEMEARQFRYMAEYNQLYDQQVIQSLLWIISKLELERSVLQNQLKRCRKRLLQGGLFDEIVGEAEENQDDETVSDLLLIDQSK